jgi:hypothetical protein
MANRLELDISQRGDVKLRAEGTEAIATAERVFMCQLQDKHHLSWAVFLARCGGVTSILLTIYSLLRTALVFFN